MLGVTWRGTHNPKSPVIVAHRKRNHRFDKRILFEGIDFRQRYVSRGSVDLINTRQNQLQGATLSSHHHVDAPEIAPELVIELLI